MEIKNIVRNIPGFRSGVMWKTIVAIVYYVLSLMLLKEGIGYTIGYISFPIMFFGIQGMLRCRKTYDVVSMQNNLVCLIIGFGLFLVGLSLI